MDAPMQLNFDVLVAVMSYLYGSDLLSAMQTCHTLYSGGIPFLLRFPVVLQTRAKVLSFCRFVLVDPARFQLLRALDISAPGRFKPGPKADLLLAMFMHAKYLEHLKISDCEILVSDQRIASAIAALASIKSLTLHTLNEAAYLVLALSQSDLVAIEIGFWRDDVMGPEDPVPLLKGFSHCLRELRVTYAEFSQHDILYPCVEILVIDDCRFALAQPLIGCFPNVSDLSLWTGQEDEALEDEEIEEHRQMNMHSQQEVGQWDSLNHLRGDIRSLYLLGLTCSVKHLDVQSTFLTSTRVRQLSTLLLQGRPYALSIRIKASSFDMGLLAQLLLPVRGSLARIIVYLDFSEFSRYPGDVLKVLVLSLTATTITCFVIHLCWDDPEQCGADGMYSYPRDRSHLELEEFAKLVIDHIPSLKYLLVDPGRPPLVCWEVIHDTKTVRELTEVKGLAIIAGTSDA